MRTRMSLWVVTIVIFVSSCMGGSHYMGSTYGNLITPQVLLSEASTATSNWSTVTTASTSSFGRAASETQRYTLRFDCPDQEVGAAFELMESLLREDLFGSGYQVDPKREKAYDPAAYTGTTRIAYSTPQITGDLRLELARETGGSGFELRWILTESSR